MIYVEMVLFWASAIFVFVFSAKRRLRVHREEIAQPPKVKVTKTKKHLSLVERD